MGSTPNLSAGITHNKAQVRVTIAPINMHPGTSQKLLEVLKSILHICGTMSPMKPIGPQKAVGTATNTPVTINMIPRRRRRLYPTLSANLSPASNAFKGFINKNVGNTTAIAIPRKQRAVENLNPLKLPNPHTRKDLISSDGEK